MVIYDPNIRYDSIGKFRINGLGTGEITARVTDKMAFQNTRRFTKSDREKLLQFNNVLRF